MNLVYEKLALNICLDYPSTTSVTVENKKHFADLVGELWNGYNGDSCSVMLSEADKKKNLTKDAIFIFNPFEISLNDRKIITQLYKDLNAITNEELIIQRSELLSSLINYFDKLSEQSPFPVVYDYDLDDTGLYKLFHVGFEEKKKSLLESIVEYIKLINSVCKIKIFIFTNLKTFLSMEEYKALYDTLKYEEVCILDIENTYEFHISEEKTYIIDKDLCIIEIN